MLLEDIKDQTALDALIADTLKTALAGMQAKNDEILAKLATARASATPEGIDLAALQKASDDLKALQDKGLEEQGEYKKLLETSREQHATALKELTDKFDASEASVKHLMVNQGLSAALSSHNINPVLLDSAIHLLSGDVTLTDLNGTRVAQVGDKNLADYVKDWIGGDVGKNFAMAQQNGGGGANGNNGTNGTPDENAKLFTNEGWDLTKQAQLYKTDPDAYAPLHKAHPIKPEPVAAASPAAS